MDARHTTQRKRRTLAEHQQTFDELCAWIEAHLHEPLGWQELMSQSGLDHQTLKALFFRFRSITPMAWIRKQRELRQGANAGIRQFQHRLSAGR